jgi:hypothetical protein
VVFERGSDFGSCAMKQLQITEFTSKKIAEMRKLDDRNG